MLVLAAPRRPGWRPAPLEGKDVIRITASVKNSCLTVKADGRLLSGDTAELIRACQGSSGSVVIDLSDLFFADREGIAVLKMLRGRGARLVGARPYVALVLEEETK